MFRALLLHKEPQFNASVQPVDESQLPDGDVHVRVAYSTLNYKDGLAITNKRPVVRQWPMVAGIDGAGTVISSSHPHWKAGDAFVHNGWGVGETQWGLSGRTSQTQGRLVGETARRFHATSSHGDWHRRLYRHAVCHGLGAARRQARQRLGGMLA